MNRLLLLVATVLAAVSCRFMDFCYDHSHAAEVRVVFNWEKAPDAEPESMSLYLFPKDGGKYLRYELTDYNGGVIRVPVGRYDALAMNSDTENITYLRTERVESFLVTTRSAGEEAALAALGLKSTSIPRASGTELQSLVLSPDFLWSCGAKDLLIEQADSVQTIEFYPEQSYCKYSVEIQDVVNLKYAVALSGSLSSMSAGWIPASGFLSEDLVTLPFNILPDKSKTTLSSSFLTFGHNPDDESRHHLVVYAILSDFSKWYCTFDVTDQIHTAPDPKDVHISLKGLSLPKPIVNGGGFQPSVSDWKSVVVELKM